MTIVSLGSPGKEGYIHMIAADAAYGIAHGMDKHAHYTFSTPDRNLFPAEEREFFVDAKRLKSAMRRTAKQMRESYVFPQRVVEMVRYDGTAHVFFVPDGVVIGTDTWVTPEHVKPEILTIRDYLNMRLPDYPVQTRLLDNRIYGRVHGKPIWAMTTRQILCPLPRPLEYAIKADGAYGVMHGYKRVYREIEPEERYFRDMGNRLLRMAHFHLMLRKYCQQNEEADNYCPVLVKEYAKKDGSFHGVLVPNGIFVNHHGAVIFPAEGFEFSAADGRLKWTSMADRDEANQGTFPKAEQNKLFELLAKLSGDEFVHVGPYRPVSLPKYKNPEEEEGEEDMGGSTASKESSNSSSSEEEKRDNSSGSGAESSSSSSEDFLLGDAARAATTEEEARPIKRMSDAEVFGVDPMTEILGGGAGGRAEEDSDSEPEGGPPPRLGGWGQDSEDEIICSSDSGTNSEEEHARALAGPRALKGKARMAYMRKHKFTPEQRAYWKHAASPGAEGKYVKPSDTPSWLAHLVGTRHAAGKFGTNVSMKNHTGSLVSYKKRRL